MILKPQNILFVDDDQYFLKAIQRILQHNSADWVVYFSQSVDAALSEIDKAAFDTIVSDVAMPGKNGLDLLRWLKAQEKTKDIPVIILTGSGESLLKRHALDLGAFDLLNKPVHQEDLFARLSSALRSKKHLDQLKEQNGQLEQIVQARTADLEASRLDIILRLGRVAEYRDEETGYHNLRVGCYCRCLASEMGMTQEYTEQIFLASPLHDIGKIGIPDAILLKSSALTGSERKIMQQHCRIGSNILSQKIIGMDWYLRFRDREILTETADTYNPLLDMAATITQTHHEKWNGSGYPDGIKGSNIPLASRIIAIADVYDALRSKRPYKPRYSEDKSYQIIQSEKEIHFDPMVVHAFCQVRKEFNLIFEKFENPNPSECKDRINESENKISIC